MEKRFELKKSTRQNLFTFAGLGIAWIVVSLLNANGMLPRSTTGLLVPICAYVVMALSLNLTVGIMGELSLGHAGFMGVGAFTGVIVSQSLAAAASVPLRLLAALLAGALLAGVFGFLIGVPVLRLRGDYLAIVTLAFGEIIKELITCLLVGVDEKGLHIIFNYRGVKGVEDLGLSEAGQVIVKGAQGATGTQTIASFHAGMILVILTLLVIVNLIDSRMGRAIMAIRDNRIAAESVGLDVARYKMLAFVMSAAMAGAAGALYGLNYSNLVAAKFDFNTSILVLVFVVLGGLGNMRGSIAAAVLLYVLPEALRGMRDYRMLIYAAILIAVMLTTNSPVARGFLERLRTNVKGGAQHE